jgi:RNA polymerase sigma factor (sigma-70 family)
MEVSALTTASNTGVLTRRTPLLRLQGDERLVAMIRDGHDRAFEVLFDRYQSRLMAFCRHLVSSQQDAEDVLQEVFVAAHAAMLADNRPINARPWLYRIARNRCLNHLRKPTADGVDSMDIHPHENGTTTLEHVQRREELRAIVSDVSDLPETQRTALVLREIDDLTYSDIALAMGTSLPAVKSLLVRARMSLAEASEARILTCDEVRLQLAEAAEGLSKATGPTRRHVKDCESCSRYRGQLRSSTKALGAMAPFGLLVLFRKLIAATKIGGSGSTAGGSATAGTAGTATSTAGGVAGTTGAVSTAGGAAAAAGGTGATLGGAVAATGAAAGGIGGALGAKAAVGFATAALFAAGATGIDEMKGAGERAAAPIASAVGINQARGILATGTNTILSTPSPIAPAAPTPTPLAAPVSSPAPPAPPAPADPPPADPAPPAEPPAPAPEPQPEPPADDGGGIVVEPVPPPDDTTPPPDDTTPPPDDTTPPPDDTTPPPDDSTPPPDDSTPPPDDSTPPPDDSTPPPDDSTPPPDDSTPPPDETTVPPDETTVPPEDTTPPTDTQPPADDSPPPVSDVAS